MEAEAYLDAVRLLGDNPAAADWAAKARAIFERLEMKPFLALLDAAIKPGAAKKSAAARPTSVEVASEPA